MPHPHTLPQITETGGRYDMYRFIHKALRKAQCDMLIRIGQIDSRTDVPALIDDLKQRRVLLSRRSPRGAYD